MSEKLSMQRKEIDTLTHTRELKIHTLGKRIDCQEYFCDWCQSRFLYQGIAKPADRFFVVSDDVPAYCPHCGKTASVLTIKR
jgi:hypothetical protein